MIESASRACGDLAGLQGGTVPGIAARWLDRALAAIQISRLREKLRAGLASAPNHIALTTGLRGTIATFVPLVLTSLLGLGSAGEFAVLGALNTAVVDLGGAYQNRFAAMAALTLVGPFLVLAGMATGQHWYLAGGVMLLVALAGGLVRALGPGAVPLGLNNAVAFLIGLQVGEATGGTAVAVAVGYFLGGVWTIFVTLVLWQLRPYRRVRQEIASAWQALADLVAEAPPPTAADPNEQEAHELRFFKQHRATNDVRERARTSLGEIRAGTRGFGESFSQLLVLLRAVERIDAAVVTLEDVAPSITDATLRDALAGAVTALAGACRMIANLILAGGGTSDLTLVRQRFTQLADLAKRHEATGGDTAVQALAQALRHLDNAEEAVHLLFGGRGPRLVLPQLSALDPYAALQSLRAQLTFKSIIFRHAIRVAVVAAACTALVVRLELYHGIWLPMTALLILQPDYGGTLTRALQRTAGTLAGAVLAGALLTLLRGTAALEAAIAVLLAATFPMLRRHYGLGITLLTPLIILLLHLSGPDPWIDLRDRIVDTLAGAVIAVIAGYTLWPLWERERLAVQFARALRIIRTYLGAVLDAMAGAALPPEQLAASRRDAEIQAGNVDAAFERMLAEPRHQRGGIEEAFALDTYVQRLAHHAVALAAQLDHTVRLPADDAGSLKDLLMSALEDIAAALAAGRSPQPRPDFDSVLERLRVALTKDTGAGSAISLLLGKLVSDTTALNATLIKTGERQAEMG